MFNSIVKVVTEFKCVVRKATGGLVTQTAEFRNIVLTSGIAAMKANNYARYLVVGTDGTAPNVTQTQLLGYVADTSKSGADTKINNLLTKPYYVGLTTTYTFAEGVAAGVLKEIGLANRVGSNPYTYPCWNRALIKDSSGNPTTLTILADEILDVTVSIRMYPADTITGTLVFKNKLGETVSTHAYTGYLYVPISVSTSWGTPMGAYSVAFHTNTPALNDNPSISLGGTVLTTVSSPVVTYPADGQLNARAVLTLTNGNGSIDGIHIRFSGLTGDGSFGYKIKLATPIVKDNTKEFTWDFTLNWAGYTGAL